VSTFARSITGDLSLTVGSNGLKNLTVVQSLGQCTATKLQDRFRLALGTWFLNTLEGVPWLQVVLVKNPSIPAIRQLFTAIILGTPGISSMQELVFNYNEGARNLAYTFTALLTNGQTLSGGSNTPFIVS
jgi:hypothetical protein